MLCQVCALFQSHLWIQTGVTVRKRSNWGKIYFDLCDFDLRPLTLTFCMGITFVNGNNSSKFHGDTMTGTLWKMYDRRTDRWTDGKRCSRRAARSQLKTDDISNTISTTSFEYFNTWYHTWHPSYHIHMATQILMPDGTMPLPEPMVTNNQRDSLACTLQQFYMTYSSVQSVIRIRKLRFEYFATSPKGQYTHLIQGSPQGLQTPPFKGRVCKASTA